MTTIDRNDFIHSVDDALQYISYYHPPDFLASLSRAYDYEQSAAAKDAIAQILVNSRMCAEGRRPICQDTGIVNVFLKVGMGVHWSDSSTTIEEMVNEAVRRAYLNDSNRLRASIVADPAGSRTNTGDNTPAVVSVSLVAGDKVEVVVAAKGGGSEAKSKFAVLNPSDSVVDWVVGVVPGMGAGWCPPGILGIGIGGTAEKAMLLAKEALMDPIDIQELIARGPSTRLEEMRVELYHRVNGLGIGAQGLGGLTTVLDIKIRDYPTHAANLPVAVVPNCAATRHVSFVLDGSGPAKLEAPSSGSWPRISGNISRGRAVDIDRVSRDEVARWAAGDLLLLKGSLLGGRDAAHRRFAAALSRGESLPVDLRNRFIYYVGPVEAVGDEIIGPAGPTTATRMDGFLPQILSATGLLGMIGKGERGAAAIKSIREHGAVYLTATGGAAYLISKAIRKSRVVAFEDLGMEAVYEFQVEEMPVMVAVDSRGNSIHEVGPATWRAQIGEISARQVSS
jgi:fumarate hydratase class I